VYKYIQLMSSHTLKEQCNLGKLKILPVINCIKILYKYILLVRVICEKYRLRGEAIFPVLETGIFRK